MIMETYFFILSLQYNVYVLFSSGHYQNGEAVLNDRNVYISCIALPALNILLFFFCFHQLINICIRFGLSNIFAWIITKETCIVEMHIQCSKIGTINVITKDTFVLLPDQTVNMLKSTLPVYVDPQDLIYKTRDIYCLCNVLILSRFHGD